MEIGVRYTTSTYTDRNHSCIATAQPAYSRTLPGAPATPPITTTAEMNARYAPVGPSARDTRCRTQICRDIRPLSRQCVHDTALA